MFLYGCACFHELLGELKLAIAFEGRRFFVGNHQIPTISSMQRFTKIHFLSVIHSENIVVLHP